MPGNDDLALELDGFFETGKLRPLFQPMVDLRNQTVFAYEGSIQDPGYNPFQTTAALFEAARQQHRLMQLSLRCHQLLLCQFAQFQLPNRLFLRSDIAVLRQPRYLDQIRCYLKSFKLEPGRVVIELIGALTFKDIAPLLLATQRCRESGIAIALDNLGGYHVSLKLWSQIQPDFVKTDPYFAAGISDNKIKRRCIRSILENAAYLGSRVIVTGIERREDCLTVRKLGAEYGQGAYLGQPAPTPATRSPRYLFGPTPGLERFQAPCAKDLLLPMPQLPPATPLIEVARLFEINPALPSVAITQAGVPLGIVTREDLQAINLRLRGLNDTRYQPVARIMRKRILKAGIDTPLETLSKWVSGAEGLYTTEILLVDSRGHLAGKTTLLKVLKTITELQLENARHANPLTLLPGNVPLQRTLEQWLAQREGFAVAYFDLNHFKPFNDHCGYSRGDQAIKLVADLLTAHADPEQDFIGHIGGDDFIVLYRHPDWRGNCHRLLETFQHRAPQLYSETLRAKSCIIEGLDRFGNPTRFPVISLAIGVVEIPPSGPVPGRTRIAELASQAKSQAKKMGGNNIFVMAAVPTG